MNSFLPFPTPARNPAGVGFPQGDAEFHYLLCASHLLHEDDPLNSLQHHEQWGVCLTTGFILSKLSCIMVGIGNYTNSSSASGINDFFNIRR